MTTGELALLLNGVLDGDPGIRISGVSDLSDAQPGQLSFLKHRKYAGQVAGTRASALIVDETFPVSAGCCVIRVADVDAALAALNPIFASPCPAWHVPPGIHATATVHPAATLGDGCAIGPYCLIEAGAAIGPRTVMFSHCTVGPHAVIGADGVLHPFVTVHDRVTIGDRAILHSGAVIGDDGFGYDRDANGAWIKVPQTGTVEIGHDVEIGSNTCVDRARFGRTIIEDGVKIDNLVQVAHNVRIGAHSAVAGQAGFAGSARVGRRVRVGGQAGIGGHIEAGDDAIIGGRAAVTKDVPPGTHVSGNPAVPHRTSQKRLAHLSHLPKLADKVHELEARLKVLEGYRA